MKPKEVEGFGEKEKEKVEVGVPARSNPMDE